MQKKKEFSSKVKKWIWLSVIMLILGAIAIGIDIKMPFNLNVSNAIVVLLTFLTVIFTLWFSYLLVVKQIYSNRYSSQLITKYINEGKTALSIYFFCLFIVGIILLINEKNYSMFSLFYVTNCIIFIILCGNNILYKLGTNEIKKIIKEKIKAILGDIEGGDLSDKLKNELKKLINIYDEAYLKNESDTCKIIINSYFSFVKKYIENRNREIISSDKEHIEKLDLLIAFQNSLLKKDTSDFSIDLNTLIMDINFRLAEISIKCDLETVLNEFLESFSYVLTFDHKLSEILFDKVYHYIFLLEQKAISLNRENLFDTILQKSKTIFYLVKFEKVRIDSNAFVRHYILGVLESIKKDKEYYKKYFSALRSYIISEITVDNCDNVSILISMLLNNEIFNNFQEIKIDLYDLLLYLADNKTIYNDQFVIFIMYASDKFKEVNELDRAFEIRYVYSKNIIENVVDVPGYIFPKFGYKIDAINNNEEKNSEHAKKMYKLISKAIEKNKLNWVSILLNDIIEVLVSFKKQDKSMQLTWLKLFHGAMSNVSLTNNDLMQELVIRYYKYAIIKMDGVKNISQDLGVKIISNLKKLCEFRYRENVDFICEIIEVLDELLDQEHNLYFVNKYTEIRELIFDGIFNIAIDSIEKNQDLVIKRISNIIGWRIQEMIEKGNRDIANKLIDNALTIFKLSKANKISDQTIVFIGTLFIIIGAYSTTDPRYFCYKIRIINELKKDDANKQYLEVSKAIRQSETRGWTILGNKPEQAISKFWSEYRKCV